jgi:hypothetical protein
METVTSYLNTLARETGKSETTLMTLALEVGLRHLWRERILTCYLCGDLSRREAIEAVGIDWVELADRRQEAMIADLKWGISS